MPERQHLRATKPLTGEMIAVLTILRDSKVALTQVQIQTAVGPKGERVSIAEACEYLEDRKVEFIERTMPPPKTAKFIMTDEGERALRHHRARAIADLERRIADMERPHSRDKSVLPEEIVQPYKNLLEYLKRDKFRKPVGLEEELDDEGGEIEEPRPSRALERAKAERDRQIESSGEEREDEGLAELEEEGDPAETVAEKPGKKAPKAGSRGNRIPRSAAPLAGRKNPANTRTRENWMPGSSQSGGRGRRRQPAAA